MKNLAPSATESQPISTHVANGRLAKGAKSPEGLARSARNATKHGLSGRSFCLLSNEDPEQFEAVRAQYFAIFNPRDPIEVNFATQFVEAYWLQQRCSLFIARTLSQEIAEQRDTHKESSPGLTEVDLAVYSSATLHDRSNLIQIYERYRSTHTRNMLRFHSAIIRHRESFGTASSLPAAGDQSTPESMFLPGLIGTPATAPDVTPTVPEPAPNATATPVQETKTANYETNPLPQPELKFTFAAEVPAAPKPINPSPMPRPNLDSEDTTSQASRPLHPKPERIA